MYLALIVFVITSPQAVMVPFLGRKPCCHFGSSLFNRVIRNHDIRVIWIRHTGVGTPNGLFFPLGFGIHIRVRASSLLQVRAMFMAPKTHDIIRCKGSSRWYRVKLLLTAIRLKTTDLLIRMWHASQYSASLLRSLSRCMLCWAYLIALLFRYSSNSKVGGIFLVIPNTEKSLSAPFSFTWNSPTLGIFLNGVHSNWFTDLAGLLTVSTRRGLVRPTAGISSTSVDSAWGTIPCTPALLRIRRIVSSRVLKRR
jgi:hypothetical protein